MTKKKSPGPLETENPRTWQDIRKKCKMLGVFEVNHEHEFYNLTCMMKEGLRSTVQTSVDEPPLNELTDENFKATETEIHKDFEMVTFAGPVFAHLRHSLGISKEEYQTSLSSDGCYLQFISNSKSKR
ncbi:phosphatidylinositol 4-phosphate 5-kinase-like protein 1 [Aplochiton taeniatus]